MSKNKKALVAVFAILGIVAVGLTTAVFAKYLTTLTSGNGTATVAKWAFSTDNANSTITCQLDQTYDSTKLVAGKIAPGTSGKCPIVISNANSEVGVEYVITPKTVTGKPTNVKLYKDAEHTKPFSATAGETITGTLAPKAAASTVYVYWNWAYETTDGDATDTSEGEAAGSMTLNFEITGTQVNPAN